MESVIGPAAMPLCVEAELRGECVSKSGLGNADKTLRKGIDWLRGTLENSGDRGECVLSKEGEVAWMTVKETMHEIIDGQPDDSSYDEILRELAFARMVEKGLRDSQDGRVVTNEEVRKRIDSWRK